MSCYYINQITDALRNHGEDRLPNRITIHIIPTIDLNYFFDVFRKKIGIFDEHTYTRDRKSDKA